MERSAGRFYAETRMFRGAAAALMAVALVASVGSAYAGQPATSVGGATPSATTQAAATTLKLKTFNAQGTGALTNTASGTCFGETCNASSGACACETFSGTTKAPFLGKSTWTVEYTENDNDVTPTGNGGHCFPSEGELIITGAKGVIVAEVSGPLCQNFLGNELTTFVIQYGQAFQIDPALSTGTAAGLNGGGSFSLSASLVSGGIATMTANGFSAR